MDVYTTLNGQKNLPRYFSVAFNNLSDLKLGVLDLKMPDGRIFRINGREPGPHGVLEVINPGLFSRVVRDGELGFAEAYMDGWWDTPDLQALLDVFLLSNDEIREDLPGVALVRIYERLRHWLRSNSKRQARATAQAQKYENICDIIGARDNHHVLEIGCGWGGFAEHAAKTRGAKVTGLTISKEQHDFAKERMYREGLNEKVEIVMRDYRDEGSRYDGIASIEMFEAVGEAYWPAYFNTVRDRLNPGAIAGLQIITVSDHIFDSYRKSVDFIQKYIFPGGMLPSKQALSNQFDQADLMVTEMLEFGDSYSETLRRWYKDFNQSWSQIEPLGFDDRFRRMWNFYLAVLLYHVEDLQKSGGVNHFFFAFIGFIVGWQKLGPAAERGYFGAWSGGIAAAIIVYFVCALIAACHFVYRGFFYHAYDTIDELVEGWFTKTFEYALLISTWQVLVVAIFGGMLAGTFSAMAGRLWR